MLTSAVHDNREWGTSITNPILTRKPHFPSTLCRSFNLCWYQRNRDTSCWLDARHIVIAHPETLINLNTLEVTSAQNSQEIQHTSVSVPLPYSGDYKLDWISGWNDKVSTHFFNHVNTHPVETMCVSLNLNL